MFVIGSDRVDVSFTCFRTKVCAQVKIFGGMKIAMYLSECVYLTLCYELSLHRPFESLSLFFFFTFCESIFLLFSMAKNFS